MIKRIDNGSLETGTTSWDALEGFQLSSAGADADRGLRTDRDKAGFSPFPIRLRYTD